MLEGVDRESIFYQRTVQLASAIQRLSVQGTSNWSGRNTVGGYSTYISQMTEVNKKLEEQAKKKAALGKTLRHVQVLSLLFNKYFEHPRAVRPSRLITGRDVMDALNLPPSPKIGQILEAVAVAQVEGKVHDKKSALAFIKTLK